MITNKKIVLLGASSDVSIALAKLLIPYNNEVILAGRNLPELEKIVTDLSIRTGASCQAVLFDAVDFKSHQAFVASFEKAPDMVISVFGYLGDEDLARADFKEAAKMFNSNFLGAVSILDEFAKVMVNRGYGIIVGISSVAGDRGRQSNYYYGSAKAGFSAYLSGLRNYLFHKGIHVMTVKPGFMRTKMTSHLKLPPVITSTPEVAAKQIIKGIEKKKNVIYVTGIWFLIMFIIKNVPEFIFKKLKL